MGQLVGRAANKVVDEVEVWWRGGEEVKIHKDCESTGGVWRVVQELGWE
jgi:hypothetical protein